MAQQDTAIIERRLRPIYDAIENKSFKKALHEADKILKKTPNLLCALTLKGYSLIRIARRVEGESIIKQVVDEKSCDDLTLQVLAYVFRDLDDYASICKIYENALEKDKNNEELLTQLFVAQSRLNKYTDQQKVAMQLYKIKPKNPYYCWTVMSLLLKATQGDDKNDPIKRKISLELAQRMMEKLINDNKLEAEQEAQLYLIICEKQNKYAEQLAFLDSEIGQKVYPGAPIEMRIELMKNLKQWKQVNVLIKTLLCDNIDRWNYYKIYIQTVAALVTDNNEGDKPEEDQRVDNTFEKCHEYLKELIELGNKKYRGPYLARLELYRVMSQHKIDAKPLLGDFMEMLIDYFRIFGEKPCCAKDLILFLDDLEVKQRPELASKLIRLCDISATTLPRSKEQMQRHICSLQISRICGAHKLSTDHLTALYTAFTLHYEHGLNAFSVDMLPTDIGIPDAFALLAVHVLYDVAIKLKSSTHLVEALCLLHYLLANSPNNFHAKLLAVQLYHRIGCPYGAHKMYTMCNFKFIQLHSMGFLHCARLAVSGLYTIAEEVYIATSSFFENYLQEGHEFTAMCYKFGSFSKLEEMMEFREKLISSFHCTLTFYDYIILRMVALQPSKQHELNDACGLMVEQRKTPERWITLSDDRDLSVIARWDPIDKETEKQQNDEILRQDTAVAGIRMEIPYVVTYCSEMLANKERPDIDESFERWPKMFADIRATNYEPISDEYLVNQLPSRLHGLLEMPYEGIFQNFIDLIKSLEHRFTEPIDNVRQRLAQHFTDLNELCLKRIDENNTCEDRLWNRRQLQETIAMAAELFSIAIYMLVTIHKRYVLMSKTANKSAKRNKKKITNDIDASHPSFCVPSEREKTTVIISLLNQLKSSIVSFDAAVESWKVPVLPKSLSEILASLSLNPTVAILTETYGNIKENHERTIKEIRENLAFKIATLNNIVTKKSV